MKSILRKLFSPVLQYFEADDNQYPYKPSHRLILIVVGGLFLVLAAFGAFIALVAGQAGGLIPTLVFFLVGAVCEIVGLLGSDSAVANLWKSR